MRHITGDRRSSISNPIAFHPYRHDSFSTLFSSTPFFSAPPSDPSVGSGYAMARPAASSVFGKEGRNPANHFHQFFPGMPLEGCKPRNSAPRLALSAFCISLHFTSLWRFPAVPARSHAATTKSTICATYFSLVLSRKALNHAADSFGLTFGANSFPMNASTLAFTGSSMPPCFCHPVFFAAHRFHTFSTKLFRRRCARFASFLASTSVRALCSICKVRPSLKRGNSGGGATGGGGGATGGCAC
mmetsp:Transcript_24468/g.61541  ORF Transcript_24468/g.61541 Transcript_24468/m.61541 type:complete len:244 (+) Transcript_24468:265-996(+)